MVTIVPTPPRCGRARDHFADNFDDGVVEALVLWVAPET
jgi:hypothetical protein